MAWYRGFSVSRVQLLPVAWLTRLIAAIAPAAVCIVSAGRAAEFEIFDEETTKKIKDEHEKDMEDAANAVGESRAQLALQHVV